MTLKFNHKADKFPAAQWVEHLTAPCCGPWSGFNPWRGESCHFCLFFFYPFFFSFFTSYLSPSRYKSLMSLFVDTHTIYHQIDDILSLKMPN